jgi:amino acid transporter
VSVPAGEARSPRQDLPFAFISTIVAVTLVMTLAQVVALGTLPDLGASKTPLADASLILMGSAGALIMGVGSVVSMTGNNAGQALTGSRMLYALAEHRQLPAFFGRIHPEYRTPVNAILFTTAVALALALSGSFVMLAAVSAVARLVTYTGACAATLVLRRPRYESAVKPATFVTPGGWLIPVLAIAVSLAILAGASREQLIGGLLALVAGAVLYLVNDRQRARGPS